MYEIVAKTEMRKAEFIDRLKRGADSLEIQLLPKPNDNMKLLLPYTDKVHVVHTMLDHGIGREVEFEDMDDWAVAQLDEGFKIAQAFSQRKRMVGVVMHLQTGYTYLKQHQMFQPAFLKLETMLEKYPNTYALIENGMIVGKNNGFNVGFNGREFAECVRKIREMSRYPDRIFSLLDTTHTKSNAIIESQIFRKALWEDIYESWFKDASDTLREIHFANCINLGIGEGEHAVDFKDDIASREFFKLSMKMAENYCSNGILCIEVYEKNYMYAKNFSHIRSMIQKYKVKAA